MSKHVHVAASLGSVLILLGGCQGDDSAAGIPAGPSFAKKATTTYLKVLPDWTETATTPGLYQYGTGLPFVSTSEDVGRNCSLDQELRLIVPAGVPGNFIFPQFCPALPGVGLGFPYAEGSSVAGDQDPYGDPVPGYELKGRSGWHEAGWMSTTLRLTWQGCDPNKSDYHCNFVWTDGKAAVLEQDASGNVTSALVSGHCAKLYIAKDTLPINPAAGAPTCASRDKAGNPVPGYPLELNVVMTVQRAVR